MATRFVTEVGTVVDRISAAPYHFPVVHADVRRARFRHFPYALFFRVANGAVHVIACFHSSRDPRQWQRRAVAGTR
ncbi:MAG: hypothetical protein ACREE2_21750 [Stellaceae bacterium]